MEWSLWQRKRAEKGYTTAGGCFATGAGHWGDIWADQSGGQKKKKWGETPMITALMIVGRERKTFTHRWRMINERGGGSALLLWSDGFCS